jgi:hypothetical protein
MDVINVKQTSTVKFLIESTSLLDDVVENIVYDSNVH